MHRVIFGRIVELGWIVVAGLITLAGCEQMPAGMKGARDLLPSFPSIGTPAQTDTPPPPPAPPSAPVVTAPSGKGYLAHPTPAEQAMQRQASEYGKVVMGGVIHEMMTSGAKSAALCQIRLSNNPRERNQCVAAALIVTGLIGGNKGYTAAVDNEFKTNKLLAARKVTSDMAADTDRLKEMVEISDAMLKESKARLTQLNADIRAKRITKEDLDRERAATKANAQVIAERIAVAKQTREEYQKSIASLKFAPAQRKETDAQLAQMSQQIAALESKEKQLREVMSPTQL